jgi:hypothetical protein
MDKKIRELMKVCITFELKTPTLEQVGVILKSSLNSVNATLHKNVARFMQGDLRKIETISGIFNKQSSGSDSDTYNSALIQTIFQPKANNEDSKTIVKKLINSPCKLTEHSAMMNETDRTIVGLLWHENVVDVLAKQPNQMEAFRFYKDALDNICLADYIDRITFQKQIWQFNEMSSMVKTFKNNKIYHETLKNNTDNKTHFKSNVTPNDIRFTKVLTKYSTEYNNSIFIQDLCQQLSMDKKDLFGFFISIRNTYNDINTVYNLFENYEINKLDINRIYRYLDKYMKEDAADIVDKETEIDVDCEIGCYEGDGDCDM